MNRKYIKDYKKGESGYDYVGNWYAAELQTMEWKQQICGQAGIAAAASVLLLTGLSLQNVGNRVLFILIPYLFLILPIAFLWRGCGTLFYVWQKSRKDPHAPAGKVLNLKQSEYDRCIRIPQLASLWLLLLAAGTLLADLLWLLIAAPQCQPMQEAAFAFCIAGLFLTGLLSRKLTGRCRTVRMDKK